MKKYFELTKFGIVTFVIFTALGGYLIGHPFNLEFSVINLLICLLGLYFLSSGSFALNQYQEHTIDAKMPRTQNRPIPSGRVTPKQALVFALSFIFLGTLLLMLVSIEAALEGLFTVLLYNYFYTKLWKLKSPFAAVPGAIPGAMPFVIGYTAASGIVFDLINIYFFLLMFFWQMPHFWALALRYQEDYRKGGIPVLPASRGLKDTQYYVGLYTFAYLTLALSAPFVLQVGWAYLFVALPFAFKVLWELFAFLKDPMGKRWLGFFLWTTFSILIFIMVPAIDRWSPWI
jgi:heme o synthase